MPEPVLQTTKPSLSVTATADWMAGRVRVDTIRRDTILALAAAWHEDPGGVMDAIDRLAQATAGDPPPEELDALVEGVEDATSMDDATAPIGLADALRLQGELTALIRKLSRFNPSAAAEASSPRPNSLAGGTR